LQAELRLQKLCVAAARRRLVASAHDLSDGGLAVAVAESCISGRSQNAEPIGAVLELGAAGRPDALLFGESASCVLFSCAPAQAAAFERLARTQGVPLRRLGTVGGTRLRLKLGRQELDLGLQALEAAYRHAFDCLDD
jgi:phosphoribosylformylglycinamidine synthase